MVAAKARGAFSPFGDIRTLMVWQAGKVEFAEFFAILAPPLVNWLVPAILLSFAIRRGHHTRQLLARHDLGRIAMVVDRQPVIFLVNSELKLKLKLAIASSRSVPPMARSCPTYLDRASCSRSTSTSPLPE